MPRRKLFDKKKGRDDHRQSPSNTPAEHEDLKEFYYADNDPNSSSHPSDPGYRAAAIANVRTTLATQMVGDRSHLSEPVESTGRQVSPSKTKIPPPPKERGPSPPSHTPSRPPRTQVSVKTKAKVIPTQASTQAQDTVTSPITPIVPTGSTNPFSQMPPPQAPPLQKNLKNIV